MKNHEVLLLERLGNRLADSQYPVAQQIEIICETLKLAWQPVDQIDRLTSGAEQARRQAQFISTAWEALDRPCPEAIIQMALEYASARENAYDPTTSCLVHGDAHIWNTLQAPDSATQFKFVDLDGLFAEPALDLAISLREWRDELHSQDALETGQARCALLSELTGVDHDAIWQWGFIEHVSCGLLDTQVGNQKAADQHFAIAGSWLDA